MNSVQPILQHSPELPGTEGVVQAGAIETKYRRAGAGLPVLLVGGRERGDARQAMLFRGLARTCRVTSVAPPFAREGGAGRIHTGPLSGWLRGLMDALGLERASMVASAEFGLVVLGFALAEPERVERIILLDQDVRDPAIPHQVLEDALERSGHPLLIVRWGMCGPAEAEHGAAVAAILRFVAAGRETMPPSPT